MKKQINKLIGQTVEIISTNENYSFFLGKKLQITHASIGGLGYDNGVYPDALCCFKIKDTNQEIPFSLYEYEFQIL